ncbi:MAG: hypothetical protein IJV35_02340 [Neisseriaceae bacterium]|nr:hypothetical protein [Neisseriaceae bacterium]
MSSMFESYVRERISQFLSNFDAKTSYDDVRKLGDQYQKSGNAFDLLSIGSFIKQKYSNREIGYRFIWLGYRKFHMRNQMESVEQEFMDKVFPRYCEKQIFPIFFREIFVEAFLTGRFTKCSRLLGLCDEQLLDKFMADNKMFCHRVQQFREIFGEYTAHSEGEANDAISEFIKQYNLGEQRLEFFERIRNSDVIVSPYTNRKLFLIMEMLKHCPEFTTTKLLITVYRRNCRLAYNLLDYLITHNKVEYNLIYFLLKFSTLDSNLLSYFDKVSSSLGLDRDCKIAIGALEMRKKAIVLNRDWLHFDENRTFFFKKTNEQPIHVAIEVSGQIRGSIEDNISNILNIRDNITVGEVDVFLDSWSIGNFFPFKLSDYRIWGKELGAIYKDVCKLSAEQFVSLFPATTQFLEKLNKEKSFALSATNEIFKDFTDVRFEKEEDISFPTVLSHKNSFNQAKMWYKIFQAHRLATAHGYRHGFEYDVSIRIRPDLNISSRDVSEMVSVVSKYKNIVFTHYNNNDGFGDQFLICSKMAMDRIASLWCQLTRKRSFRYIPELHRTYQAESFITQNCALLGLEVVVFRADSYQLGSSQSELLVNTITDDITPFLQLDVANQPNQEGRLFVEKYIENKKNGIIFK